MTSAQDIDYEALSQDAMRGVVRTVLQRVAASGLPGEHHFYIAFNTQAPGVNISKRLKEKYAEEMTIVLQHRFWDLAVLDERFEVKLTFDGIPERLVVPFKAVKVFFDPSVPYGLQFEESELTADAARRSSDDQPSLVRSEGRSPSRVPGAGERAEKRRPPRRPKQDRANDASEVSGPAPTASSRASATKPQPALSEPKASEPSPLKPAGASAKIVSLDQFRKK
jgi:hypothetical protein